MLRQFALHLCCMQTHDAQIATGIGTWIAHVSGSSRFNIGTLSQTTSLPLVIPSRNLTALVIAHHVWSRHAHPSSLPCSWCISKLLACPRMPVAAFHNSIHSNIQTECLPPARKGVIAAGQVMLTTVPSIMQHQSLPYGALDACGWSGAHQRIQLDDRAFQKFILMLRARTRGS